jgi:DNA invertase Pin-like site-specific DNA recombinase
MPYIMYLRKSRTDRGYAEESVELTLSRHRERLEELCRSMGIHCSIVLQEVSSADSITGRPEMIRLLQMVETGAYNGVVCIDMDRLSRGSGADQALVISTFKYSNTKIITPGKVYDFAVETDEQFAELSLFLAKQEYRQIKKRLYQGRLDSVKEGKWCASKAPYGYESYKLTGQKGLSLRIVPEEADVVRMIYRKYLSGEGLGCGSIAAWLNRAGIRTRSGAPWRIRSVHNILRNPVYTGKTVFARYKAETTMEDGEPVTRIHSNRAPVVAQGLHEAIIDQETYDRAQELLRDHRATTQHLGEGLKNPLTMVLRCGYCGGRYAIKMSRHDGTQIASCMTKGCPGRAVRIDLVEDRILTALEDELRLQFAPAEQSPPDTAEPLRKREKALQAALERQADAYEMGVYSLQEYAARSAKTKEDLAAVRRELDALAVKIREREELIPRIRTLVETYRGLSTERKNQLLRELIVKVEIRKDTSGIKKDQDFDLVIFPRITR